MSQPLRLSVLETVADTALGLVLTALLNRYYLELPLDLAVRAVGVYTAVSVCRRFVTRRVFDRVGVHDE